MTSLYFEGLPVPIVEGESVLDALLRAKHDIPYGCKSGACQSCMLLLEQGDLPPNSQPGLTASQKDLGYFLSCSCYPKDDDGVLQVRVSETPVARIQSYVVEKSFIGKQVIRLRVRAPVYYQPGQYVTLWQNDHLARSYSIASVPTLEDFIEFHIKHIPNGAFSEWAASSIKAGDILEMQGPMGQCFYTASNKEQPLLLAGIGTGLAPLYGILRDALQQGHRGNLELFIAAKNAEQFYYVAELLALQKLHSHFRVTFVAQNMGQNHDHAVVEQGDIYATIKARFPNLTGYRVFLCGAESFVKKLKKQCFLAGAKMQDIAADAFLPFGN